MKERLALFLCGVLCGVLLCAAYVFWHSSNDKVKEANNTTVATMHAADAAQRDDKKLASDLRNSSDSAKAIKNAVDEKLSKPLPQVEVTSNEQSNGTSKVTCPSQRGHHGVGHTPALSSGDSLMPFDDDTIELLNKARKGSSVRAVPISDATSGRPASSSEK